MSDPDGFVPLPFAAARGVPQTVQTEVGGHRLRVTLAVAASDLPALIATSPTSTLVDLTEGRRRRTSVPGDVRDRFRSGAPATLSTEVVRPVLLVRERGVLLGARPASVGAIVRYGSVDQGGLVAEVLVHALELVAGALTGPGELGGRISIGIRAPVPLAPVGRRRPLSPEQLHASLT
jgi:hypothetical protein